MTKYPFKKHEMEQFYQSGENPWGYGEEYNKVYRRLFGEISDRLPEFLFVLELGCGEGYFAKTLLDYFGDRIACYVGVDISAVAIEVIARRLKDYQDVFFIAEDFESGDNWVEYLEDINFVVANESLYYCDRPKTVVEKLDRHMLPSSYLLIADSIVRYNIRESPHREFNFELIEKITNVSNLSDGNRWSLKAFLTKKKES